MRRILRSLALLAALAASGGGAAAQGTAAAQIVVGQTSGFTGPVAPGVKENTEGARLWFDHVNARGGVHGQRIELVSLDDAFEPPKAAANARTLIVERGAIALFMNRGTPHTEAIRPLLEEFRVPLVAPSTGAMLLHRPVHPWIFNVRAPYQREAEKAVQHLATLGLTRIGLVHVDDSFGADCAEGARRGFERARLRPAFTLTFDRARPDFAPLAAQAVQHDVQALLFYGASASVADGVRALRAAGSQAQVVTASNNASAGFVKLLGAHARGTIVSQVFPSERSLAYPVVQEAQALARARGLPEVTPAMLEGFIGARVLVEGLRQAGAQPTRQRLRDALEGMKRLDIGGLELGYSPQDHSGLDHAELSIIDQDGRFRR